jgi:hypothetical protein
MSNTKVLVITKPDKTNHILPLKNKAFWEAHNKRQPANLKVRIREMEVEEAEKLPFRDENYITPAEALTKANDLSKDNDALTKANAEKDQRIAELMAELEGKKAGGKKDSNADDDDNNEDKGDHLKKADEVIKLIKAATDAKDIDELIKGDTRKSVTDAAKKRIAELKKK